MPRMRCPRCSTSVDVPTGAKPVCWNCGLGSARTAKKSGLGGGAIAAIVIVSVLVVAGLAAAVLVFGTDLFDDDDSSGGSEPLTQAQAEQVALAAPQSLADSVATGTGDLRLMTMSMSGAVDDMDGDMSGTFEIQWGAGDVMRMSIDMQADFGGGAGFFVKMTLYCTPDKLVQVLGDTAQEARPGTGDDCDGLFGEDAGVPNQSEFEGLRPGTVTPNSDGSVTATYTDEDGVSYTAQIDPDGRITSMVISDPELTATITFEYGTRTTITVPQATERVPADITTWEEFDFSFDSDPAVQNYTFNAWDENMTRNEFSVRIKDGDTILAEFDLDDVTGSANGITYTWTGDSDDIIEHDDGFRIEAPGYDISNDLDAVIYDKWAMTETGDDYGLPGPGLLLVGIGIALVGRRQLQARSK